MDYSNDIKNLELVLKQLRKEVQKYYNDTQYSLIEHDGKIAELVSMIKNNLSSTLTEMLNTMVDSGELDRIITDTLLKITPITVKDFGAIGDGVSDDTSSFQQAIDYALENNIGRLIIPDGTYLITRTLELYETDRLLSLEIKGYGAPHIIPHLEDFRGDYLFKITNKSLTTNDFKRYLTIKDIVLGHPGDNDLANCGGMYAEQIQFLNLDNVMIRGFKKSGLILRDVFDSMVHNVRLLNIGDILGESPTSQDYALILQGEIDNVNATKFYGLHIERAPLMLKIQSKIRHCQFTDCKFEQTVPNYSPYSTIFVDGRSGENTFTNCQFVKNSNGGNNDGQYFVEGSPAQSYSESAQFFCLLDGCMFTCAPGARNSGHWLNVDGFTIVNSQFNHCGGTASGLYSFRLQANNIFKNNKVFVTSWNTNTFRITGDNNLIKDNFITYMAGANIDSGAFLSMDNTLTRNIIEGNNIKNKPFSAYAIPGNNLGDNVIRNNVGYEKTTIDSENGEPILLYGSDLLVINYNKPTPIYQIKYGYNGQRLKVYFKYEGHTINHNPDYIYLKNKTAYAPKEHEVVEFVKVNNVWYQV